MAHPQTQRTRRVGELLHRELAVAIRDELTDPRLGMVTVSGVEVSRDLAYARVFVTFTDPGADVRATLDVLKKAAGFLRHLLSERVDLRSVPQLRFVYDDSLDRGTRIDRLIDTAVAEDSAHHPDEPSD